MRLVGVAAGEPVPRLFPHLRGSKRLVALATNFVSDQGARTASIIRAVPQAGGFLWLITTLLLI
jgi:hypothetical protein